MRGPILSAMVSLEDVRRYFPVKQWGASSWRRDSFYGTRGPVEVHVRATGKSFGVRIEAVDDPSDSEEVSTEEPLKAIAEFLGRDLPGGEHFERMSFMPEAFARSLAAFADLVGSGSVGRRAAVRMLRRLSAVRMADSPPKDEGLSDLERDAKAKGWDAKLKKRDGEDVLVIDVSGLYVAEVTLDGMIYEYKFEVADHPDVTGESTTDDPIREFERWIRDPGVQDAIEDLKVSAPPKSGNDDGTVRAPADAGTVPAPAPTPAPARPKPRPRPMMEEPLS